ncbi:MAG: single-stranded DNA-binding protein [Candidatus Zixiibacteriota bacterium]|nr:MAG: single-stranded DNA-binding protein [candidate division Zixibacteria bacterium]
MNLAVLHGNLARSPELRYTANNKAVCGFTVAINESYVSQATGERVKTAVFIDCQAFGRVGENINKYFDKGDPILVHGKISQDRWVDKDSGAKRSKVYVTVFSFDFVGGGGGKKKDDEKPTPLLDGKHEPLTEEDIPF